MELAKKILMGWNISKPQRNFLVMLFSTILIVRGKVTFRNLSRYSPRSEKSYSRHFRRAFDFVGFNRQLIDEAFGTTSERIVAFDPSFIPKAGKKTYGRDVFWNGCHGRAEKGLEVSTLGIVDLKRNSGLTLSVQQTPPSPAPPPAGDAVPAPTTAPKKAPALAPHTQDTLTDAYLHHLRQVRPSLQEAEKYVVGDGYFAKKKWLDGVEELQLYTIGKLRCDARMRFFYTGPARPSGRGRQKVYDGQVDWQDLTRFERVSDQEGLQLYTQLLYHVAFQRTLRVVVVRDMSDPEKPRWVLLFSTDVHLEAPTIYRYYKARGQIELLFRDAKQYTGLTDCQAREAHRLHFHFNASLTTLNIAKIEQLQTQTTHEPMVTSIASVKAGYFNDHYLHLIFSMLAIDPTSIKKTAHYQFLRDYGKIAA